MSDPSVGDKTSNELWFIFNMTDPANSNAASSGVYTGSVISPYGSYIAGTSTPGPYYFNVHYPTGVVGTFGTAIACCPVSISGSSASALQAGLLAGVAATAAAGVLAA